MGLNMANGNPLSNANNRAKRMVVMNHVWTQDVVLYRKISLRPDEDSDPNNAPTFGGASQIGLDDEAEYQLEVVGAGKMIFANQYGGTEHAGNWQTFNTSNGDVPVLIEPVIEGEFEVKKHDRVYVILPGFTYGYQVSGISSPSSLPMGRSSVIYLQPLEQTANLDFDDLI